MWGGEEEGKEGERKEKYNKQSEDTEGNDLFMLLWAESWMF